MPAALPADPDDHDGGAPRGVTADARKRNGIGVTPAARRCHCRRPGAQPIADLVHDPRHLPLLRSAGGAHQGASVDGPARTARAARMNISAPFIRPPLATTTLTARSAR